MSFNEEWEEYTLSEILEIIGGGTPKTKIKDYWDGNIPWLSVKDFNNENRTVYQTEKNITVMGLENSSAKMLDKGDLIISARGTVGALSQLSKPMAFNQSCYGLRANEKVTNDFLYYLLKYKLYSIKQKTHGSVFDTITKDTFTILNANIPKDIKEQKLIANILSSIDKKVENNNKMNQSLEEMAQAIYRNWFIDFEPFQEGEFIESKLGMIPECWEVKNISDVVNITYGKNLAKKNMSGSGYKVFSASGLVGYHKDYLYKKPQILMTCRGSGCGDIYESSPKSFVTNNCLVFETNDNTLIDRYYLRLFLLNSNRDQFITGSAQPQITITNISKMKILIPNEKYLNKFKEIVSKFINKINSNKIENQSLRELRDTLLPKLMSGEIRVTSEK